MNERDKLASAEARRLCAYLSSEAQREPLDYYEERDLLESQTVGALLAALRGTPAYGPLDDLLDTVVWAILKHRATRAREALL